MIFTFIEIKQILALSILSAQLIVITQSAFANSDLADALTIDAAQAEIDEAKGFALYSGEVVLQQGSLKIECDSLQIFQSAGGIDKVVAKGEPALYSQSLKPQNESSKSDMIQAQAQSITYVLDKKSIELEGAAKIKLNENTFEGNSIVYQIEQRKIIANGDQNTKTGNKERVKIVLPTRNNSKE